jgi:hypothetical protein
VVLPDVVAAVVEAVVLAVLLVVEPVVEVEDPPDVLPPPAPPGPTVLLGPVVVPIVTSEPPLPNASASSSSPFAHAPEFAKKASPTRLKPKKRRISYHLCPSHRSPSRKKT